MFLGIHDIDLAQILPKSNKFCPKNFLLDDAAVPPAFTALIEWYCFKIQAKFLIFVERLRARYRESTYGRFKVRRVSHKLAPVYLLIMVLIDLIP